MLYTNIMTQTQNLVQEEAADELHMILKMRARPKVILVSNFEEAIQMMNQYRDYLLTVISDVSFKRNGVEDEDIFIIPRSLHFIIFLLLLYTFFPYHQTSLFCFSAIYLPPL